MNGRTCILIAGRGLRSKWPPPPSPRPSAPSTQPRDGSDKNDPVSHEKDAPIGGSSAHHDIEDMRTIPVAFARNAHRRFDAYPIGRGGGRGGDEQRVVNGTMMNRVKLALLGTRPKWA
eukprot:4924415-Pyramimonas_sp.AAC.1